MNTEHEIIGKVYRIADLHGQVIAASRILVGVRKEAAERPELSEQTRNLLAELTGIMGPLNLLSVSLGVDAERVAEGKTS